MHKPLFLDLFAGAGGLSEGFIQAGFHPVAHVEADSAACNTLRTRMSYHWLMERGGNDTYAAYLKRKITRQELYHSVPENIIASVLNSKISAGTLSQIFELIDEQLRGRKLDVIVGGPPCQAYSVIGRARDGEGMKDDLRNDLYIYYAEFLKRYSPGIFVFENVLGLLSAKNRAGIAYLDLMTTVFRKAGYETEVRIVSADEYGVLQRRKRVIIIGHRRPDWSETFLEQKQTGAVVWDMLQDLPPIPAGRDETPYDYDWQNVSAWLKQNDIARSEFPLTQHFTRKHTANDLEIYRIATSEWMLHQRRLDYSKLPSRLKTHNNEKIFTDRFKVVAGEAPYCHTLVAHISKDGHYYIHPSIEQNRSISPREAARIQSFPDDYYFEGTDTSRTQTAAFRQIGNAVPVILSKQIAAGIGKHLKFHSV